MTLRNLFLCVFALTLISTLTACRPARTPEPKRDVAVETRAIDTLRSQFANAYSAGDAVAAAACFTDDAIGMFPNQAAIEGKQAIQEWLEGVFKENAVKMAHTPLETQVTGDWAYERGNITIAVTPKAGAPAEMSLKYVVILKRQPDGSWKVYRDISNSNQPPPAEGSKKK